MNRKLLILVAVAGTMIGSACHREQATERSVPTETIAPATPPAAGATGTESDTVLTQTVEIGEERSVSEGGGLTDPATAANTTAAGTAATGAPAPRSKR